jgi:hypothetical protein
MRPEAQNKAHTAASLAGIFSAQHQTVPDQARRSPYCYTCEFHLIMRRIISTPIPSEAPCKSATYLASRTLSAVQLHYRLQSNASRNRKTTKHLKITFL